MSQSGRPVHEVKANLFRVLGHPARVRILELLRDLQRKRQLAYMFISHDLKVVRALSNHVIVLRNGRVVEEGSAERIFTAPETNYTKSLLAAALNLEVAHVAAVAT